jgi:glycosyltransferase involved in cell wall biosynthesis
MYKIIVLQQHYFPEMAGVARRAKELSEEFVKVGHSVTVVTTFPRDFRSIPGYKAKRNENINGVEVVRLKSIFEVRKNVLFRMFSYLAYVFSSFLYIKKNNHKYDFCISIAPLPPGVVGALAQKYYNLPHHFDVPDILPDLGIASGMIKNKIFIKLLYKLEMFVYTNCRSISAITQGQINNIHKKGVPLAKIKYIPDWVDSDFFVDNIKKNNQLIQKQIQQKYPGKKIISFIGNIGALQNPIIFIKMMEKIAKQNENIILLFIGDGIMLPSLIKEVKKLGLTNIDFVGRLPRELIPSYMNSSDVLIANYLSNKYMDICIPGKLYEYLMSKTPIVMGANGEAANFINKHNAGIAVPPSDINAFTKAVHDIIDNKFNYKPNYEEFIKEFSLNNVAKSYESVFKSLLKN